MIIVQQQEFDTEHEYQQLIKTNDTGAVVIFVGRVRDFSSNNKSFFLQHYPQMTEKVLNKIEAQARQRWPILSSTIIHRVGHLHINDQIVFVGISSRHRKAAFSACEFIIDTLKTQAPFWKKEGEIWVTAKESDQAAADSWIAQP